MKSERGSRRIRRVPKWSIGIYTGSSPFELTAPSGINNPVLSAGDVNDVAARFLADPFIIRKESVWYMFFELMDEDTGRGKIAHARSDTGLAWTYQGIVLDEQFHLSYPYVFAWGREVYMVPETGGTNTVRLYRASSFPTQWEFVGNLLTGRQYTDSSLIRYHDNWWLFTAPDPARNNSLSLFRAERLEGPWSEHPKSPLITHDPHHARPGGRLFDYEGRLYRLAQDDSPWYGRRVWAFEITHLDPRDYRESMASRRPVVRAKGFGWNSFGMHHVDPHPLENNQWLAAVDGHRYMLSFVRKL